MRAVIQRVRQAEVAVDNGIKAQIGNGLLIFLGVEEGDTPEDVGWLVQKVPQIRCFEDAEGRMNRSLLDIAGQAMVISQFTLFGNLRKGSFNRAAHPQTAEVLYEAFVARLGEQLATPVATGAFGRHMDILANNDGPVTLILDSRRKDI